MAKAEFARATLEYGPTGTEVEYGIFNLTVDSNYSEIDVSDTKTTVGESEYIGNRLEHSISFDMYKDAATADLTLNAITNNNCIITVVSATAGDDTTYTGSLVLLSKTVGGNVDGMVTVTYNGKIDGALVEAQP